MIGGRTDRKGITIATVSAGLTDGTAATVDIGTTAITTIGTIGSPGRTSRNRGNEVADRVNYC